MVLASLPKRRSLSKRKGMNDDVSWRKELKKLLKEKEKAGAKENYKMVAYYCESIGRLLFDNSIQDLLIDLIDEAIEQFKEQVKIFKQRNRKEDLAGAYHLISDVFAESGDLSQSLAYAKKYYALAQENSSTSDLQRATATIGRIHYMISLSIDDKDPSKLENLKNSLEYYKISENMLDILEGTVSKMELTEMRACLLLNLANIHESMDQVNEAEKKYMQSASLSQICHSRDTEIKSLLGIANMKMNQSMYDEAYSCAFECIRCLKKCRDKSLTFLVYFNLSKIKLCQVDFEQAARFIKICNKNCSIDHSGNMEEFRDLAKYIIQGLHALRKLPRTDSPLARVLLIHNIGNILYRYESYKNALKYFLDEEKILKSNTIKSQNKFSVYKSIGDCYFSLKNYMESIQNYNRCISFQMDKSELGEVYLKLGLCAFYLNQPFENLVENFSHAMGISESRPSLKLEILKNLKMVQEFHKKVDELQETEKLIKAIESDQLDSDTASDHSDADFQLEEELERIPDISTTEISQPTPKTKHAPSFDPNRRNCQGETLLHIACIKGNLDQVKSLIEKGADVNSRDFCGWLPLHEACNHGFVDIAKVLIDHGAYINDRGGVGCNGVTPLIDAAENGHLNVVKLLLDKGADPTISDNDNQNILSILLEKINTVGLDEQHKIHKIIDSLKNKVKATTPTYSSIVQHVEVKPPQKRKSTKLEALSDQRVPIFIAAAIKEDLKPSPSPKKPLKFSSCDNVKEYNPRNASRRRIAVISSDDDYSCPLQPEKFELPISTVQNIPTHAYNSRSSFDILLVESQKVISVNLEGIDKPRGQDLIQSIIKASGKYTHYIYQLFLEDANNCLVFPYYFLKNIPIKNNCLKCHNLDNLSIGKAYLKICDELNKVSSKFILKYCKFLLTRTSNLPIQLFDGSTCAFYYSLFNERLNVLDLSDLVLDSDIYIQFIPSLLPYFRNLEVLRLRNMMLTFPQIKTMLSIAHDNFTFESIKVLDLSFNQIVASDDEISDLFYFFMIKCPNLSSLSLAYCGIVGFFAPHLILTNYVQEHSKIREIELSGNPIEETQLKNLFNYFLPWKEMKYIGLSDIARDYDVTPTLASYLKISKSPILNVDISNNNCDGSVSLFSIPNFVVNIIELDLSNTNLNTSTLIILKNKIKNMVNLTKLNLYDNFGIFSTYEALFEFICCCSSARSLKYIDLSNTIDFEDPSSQYDMTPPLFPAKEEIQDVEYSGLEKVILNNNLFTGEALDKFLQEFHMKGFKSIVDGFQSMIIRTNVE